jgi:elongation factor G
MSFSAPPYTVALHPKTKADVDRMGPAIHKLEEEDRTISVHRDPDTAETLLSAMGEAHVDVSLEKLKRKFGVDLTTTLPRVAYKETITTRTVSEYKHKKQTGGHGQYGHVHLELEPLPRGDGFVFTERVVGGSVPRNFYPAVEKGVTEAKGEGALAHRPVVDVKVTLYDGSYHPVDSSEMAFKIAGSMAFKEAARKAQPVLLEPLMAVEVRTPEEYMGDVIGDINSRRGQIQSMEDAQGVKVVKALVPLSEMFGYVGDLRSKTSGRAVYSMEFSTYSEVPKAVSDEIVQKSKGE